MDPDLNSPAPRDAAAIAVIVSGSKVLAIRQPDRDKPQWKCPGGTVEPGESVYQGLIREIHDECGFEIPSTTNAGGTLTLGNDSVTVEYLGGVEIKTWKGVHDQHQFLVIAKDERDILYLDGQMRKEDDLETIETKVFEIDVLEGMRDFLWMQLKMLRKAKARLAETTQAA